jgi:hypothetical protein
MVDTVVNFPEGGSGGSLIPAIKTTLPDGRTVAVQIFLIAGLKTYVAAIMNSTAAASKNHLLLFNGVGSGKIVRIWDIKANPNVTAVVTGSTLVLNAARTSNQGTAGTSQPIRQTDTTDTALPSQITAVSNPTNPTFTSNELASCTVLVEETAITEGRTTLFKADSVIAPLVLNEGQGLGIQQGTLAGVGAVNIFIYFTLD